MYPIEVEWQLGISVFAHESYLHFELIGENDAI